MVPNRCRRGPRRWSISAAKVLGSQSIILGSSRHTASWSSGPIFDMTCNGKNSLCQAVWVERGVGVEYGTKRLSKRKKHKATKV